MRGAAWLRPGRGRMLLVVVLAHGLIALLLAQALRPKLRAQAAVPAAQAVWLQLLRETPAATPAAAPTRRQPATARPAPQAPQTPRTPRPTLGVAEPEAISASAVTMDPARGEPPSPTASAPLDLRLPRRASQTLPAAAMTRDDSRVRDRLSYGERMARSMGTDTTVHEDTLPDGSRRFRRGNDCIIARPSRDSELDAFNNSAAPKPRSIDTC